MGLWRSAFTLFFFFSEVIVEKVAHLAMAAYLAGCGDKTSRDGTVKLDSVLFPVKSETLMATELTPDERHLHYSAGGNSIKYK